MGETQAPARLRSTEAGAARLLDVLPAHLIPGGGPLSSMTMWWVLNLRKAEWVVVGWGGWVGGVDRLGCRLVLMRSFPILFSLRSLTEGERLSFIEGIQG